MAKRGSTRFKRERRAERNRVQATPGRAPVVQSIRPRPIRNPMDRGPRLAGGMDRVGEAKGRLDRLDTPMRDLDPFKGARLRVSSNNAKALSDHRAIQERINNSPSRPNQVRVSDMGSLTQKAKIKQVKTEHERSAKQREDTNPTCKPRPETNRGMGGSRNYVPWCNRKR